MSKARNIMGNVQSKLGMSTDQMICALIGSLPSLALFFQIIFILSTSKQIKAKCYHISGEWALRFLYFTLSITPINQLTHWGRIIQFRQTFGLLSFYYACIHLITYLKYTLEKDGRTISGFLFQLNDRDYLIYGVLAWLLMIPLAITSKFYFKSKKGLGYKNWKRLHKIVYIVFSLAAYHVITRNWNRLRRGKSEVESAALAPYIVAILLGYRIVRYIYFKYFKTTKRRTWPTPTRENNEDSAPFIG
eukprot:307443_1